MKQSIKNTFAILSSIILASALLPQQVIAQDADQTINDRISIGHAPLAEYLNLQPGESYEGEFTVWNLEGETFTYFLTVRGFEQVEDYPGTSRPLTLEEDNKDPYSASDWLSIGQTSIDLEPNKNITIPYTIRVPNDAAFGGYHVKIFLSTQNLEKVISENNTQTVLNLATGPAILIDIGTQDQLSESLDLMHFRSTERFFGRTDASLETKIKNVGNTHLTPKGHITLENIFGQEIGRIPFNENNRSVIRGREATYRDQWSDRYLFTDDWKLAAGPITARLVMTYKSENPGFHPVIAEDVYWIIPWEAILVLTVLLLTSYGGYKYRKAQREEK